MRLLTDEAIRAMPAGREIDALIAERLFGFFDVKNRAGEKQTSAVDGWTGFVWEDESGGRFKYERWLPHYSTSIADAWLVADKYNIGVWPASPHRCDFISRGIYKGWAAGDPHAESLDSYRYVWDETAPLAICHAALLLHAHMLEVSG